MDVADATNKGWDHRRAMFAKSNVVQLEGHPFVPIFMQEKLIPGNTPIAIRLFPSKDEFVLHAHADDNERYQMHIVKAYFHFCIKKVSPTLLEANVKSLMHNQFRYKYTSLMPKFHIIPGGASTFNIHNLFDGNLPDRITMALAQSTDVNGDYKTNPFYFRHCNARTVHVVVNGQRIPEGVEETNFRERWQFTCGYNSTM